MTIEPKLNIKIDPPVEIVDGVLTVHASPLTSYSLVRELPPGKNGLVFEGYHERCGHCVVKLWLRPDMRWEDRFRRGFQEACHAAQASDHWSVEMIDARMINDVFLASMKWVDGMPLRDALTAKPDDAYRWLLAKAYIEAIFATKTTPHGDAHAGNVMIQTICREPSPKAILIDFASDEVGQRSREERHWDVFRETVRDIIRKLPKFANADRDLLGRKAVVEAHYWTMIDRLKP